MIFQDRDLELKGENILINAFTDKDRESYSRILLGPLYDSLTQLTGEEKSSSGFMAVICRTAENETHAIRLLPDHRIIGWITLQKNKSGEPDIGISLLPEQQNKGYGPEAIRLYGNYLHEKYGLMQLIARTSSVNFQCRHALVKTGAILEKEIPDERLVALMEQHPDHSFRPGFGMITCCYCIPLPVGEIQPSHTSFSDRIPRQKRQAEYEAQEAQLSREIRLIELEHLQKKIGAVGKVPDAITEEIERLRSEY